MDHTGFSFTQTQQMQLSWMRKLQSKGEITYTELSAEHNPCLNTLDVTLITNRVSRPDWNVDEIGNAFTKFYDASEVWFGVTEMFQVGSEHSGHSKPGYSKECTSVMYGNIYFLWNIQAFLKGWFWLRNTADILLLSPAVWILFVQVSVESTESKHFQEDRNSRWLLLKLSEHRLKGMPSPF